MSHTVFLCGDSDSVVCHSELIFLWLILNNIDLDSGSYLVRHLAKAGKASARNIVIGKLLILIALTLGYDFISIQEAMSSMRIDLGAYIAIKMIVKEGDCYCLMLKD